MNWRASWSVEANDSLADLSRACAAVAVSLTVRWSVVVRSLPVVRVAASVAETDSVVDRLVARLRVAASEVERLSAVDRTWLMA